MTFQADLFAGKTAVVIGGTSGIGAAAAEALAACGASVVACGLNPDGPNRPRGAAIDCREIDVRNTAQIEQLFAAIPRVEILVNCAGTSHHREEWNPDSFDDIINLNFRSVFHTSRQARMKMPKGGSIINIASMYSTFGSSDRPAYASSKGAIVQLTKSMAQEYAPDVRVNAVAPGWIDTPLSTGLFADPVASAKIMSRIPAARWGGSNEVAQVIVFLASPAASYVTGAVLPVDGGYLTM